MQNMKIWIMDKKSIGMVFTREEYAIIEKAAKKSALLIRAWCRLRLDMAEAEDKKDLDKPFPPYERTIEKPFTVMVNEDDWDGYRFVAHSLGVSLARWARTRLVEIARKEVGV